MPRYFFHIFDGTLHLDADGAALPDVAIARHEAMILTGYLMRKHALDILNAQDWSVTVTDSSGVVLFEIALRLSDAASTPAAPAFHPVRGVPPLPATARTASEPRA